MENIRLSEICNSDLENLLLEINNAELKFEDQLDIKDNNKLTFGFEIEYEHADWDKVTESMEKHNGWENTFDLSVTYTEDSVTRGGEVKTPILINAPSVWYKLKEVCEELKTLGATDGNFSAAHIHIGAQYLGNNLRSWLNFVKLWAVYERVIYKFAYGEKNGYRPLTGYYARPMNITRYDALTKILNNKVDKDTSVYDLAVSIASDPTTLEKKYKGVYLGNVLSGERCERDNTIEFRCANSTLNPIIWQNDLNFFAHLMSLSKSETLDQEKLNYKAKNSIVETDIKNYNRVYLTDALELCDMMYDNSIYKYNFLKQYLKLFGNVEKEHIKSLIKKK